VESARVTNRPYVGTATGTCIAEHMARARIPSFRGKNVTMTETVSVR